MKSFQLHASRLLLTTGLLLLTHTPGAYAGFEYVPVQEKAQAQSLTGSTLLNDSLYSNPASSAFTKVYAVEGSYMGSDNFAASVLDTRTSYIGGNFGYFRNKLGGTDDILQGLKLAFSGMASPILGVGISGKLLWGPEIANESTNIKDIDAGFLANFQYLRLGAMIRNILGGDERINQGTEWSAGARINYDQILFLSAATQAKMENFTPYQYGIGAEYVSPFYLSMKGGYRFQPKTNLSYWSLGASFNGPKLAVHYAVEFPSQDNESTEHVLSLMFLM